MVKRNICLQCNRLRTAPLTCGVSSVGWSEQRELQQHPTFTVARFGMTRPLHTNVGVANPTYRAALGQRQRNELTAAVLGVRKRCDTSARRLVCTPPLVDKVRIQPVRERDLGH